MSKRAAPEEIERSSKRTKTNPEDASFVAPDDWPYDGDIDLSIHDLPHASSETEWWYINGHLQSTDGHKYSYFASFFRNVKDITHNGEVRHTHALTWCIVDAENHKYHDDCIMDVVTPMVLTKQLEKGEYKIDYRLKRALLEMTRANQLPLPDRMMTQSAVISHQTLNLDYDGQKFWKDEQGFYHVDVQNIEKGIALQLTLEPQKKPTRQGHNGYTQIGVKQDTMFYYFIPRNKATGTLTVNGNPVTVTGTGWYDHEFGGTIKVSDKTLTLEEEQEEIAELKARQEGTYKPNIPVSDELKLKPTGIHGKANGTTTSLNGSHHQDVPEAKVINYAWNWLAVQLEDGTDLTATTLVIPDTGEVLDQFALTIAKDNERIQYDDISFKGSKPWVSLRTTSMYYLHYDLDIESANIHLKLDAEFAQQECITIIAKPAFWEGRLNVTGTIGGKPVKGLAFIERHGFSSLESLEKFFKTISKEVMKEMDRALPKNPTPEQFKHLIATEEFAHLTEDANIEVFAKNVIAPLREIIDRGGKSWRSYALLLCIDAVGGNSDPYRHWLVMPEIMHVGSLIVDDIQDKSEERRGGKSAHLIYGDDLAINAGTYAYFMSIHIIQHLTPWLTPEFRARLNELFSLTLRAGHAGQAFDIHGLYYLMPEAVKNGDPQRKIERHVICTHRLKSAVPPCGLAKIGAAAGQATPEQTKLLGEYFEAIGVSFQIIDDVLNLRGTLGKTLGEDITAGKITFPVAMAMQRLDETQRQQLWATLQSKPSDPEIVAKTIALLESSGSIDACVEKADKLVNDAWAKLDGVLPPSLYKMQLRAFGFYILQQVY